MTGPKQSPMSLEREESAMHDDCRHNDVILHVDFPKATNERKRCSKFIFYKLGEQV